MGKQYPLTGPNVIVSLSGGIDSAVVLAYIMRMKKGNRVTNAITVGFYYGSKHNTWENQAAKKIAKSYDVPFEFIDISSVMKNFSSNLLIGQGDIPEGHYEDASMSQTVVPSRNLIFLSILSGLAVSQNYHQIVLGVHSGDHAIYPDCRPEFIRSADQTVSLSTDGCVHVKAPFLKMDKCEIIEMGLALGAPFHLTRTCYTEERTACGKCGSCVERLEAFKACGAIDPIEYQK